MPRLSDKLRLKIQKLFLENHGKVEIYDIVLNEALKEVTFQDEVWRCVNSTITSIVDQKYPLIKSDFSEYRNLIKELVKKKNNKVFESETSPIAKDILRDSGFTQIEDANGNKEMKFNNPPFDFFGYKNDSPYIIEYKGNKDKFSGIAPDQRRRQLRIMDEINKLNSALIQINFKQEKFRILYNEQIDVLYPSFEIPMDSIVTWLRRKL
jgi:hypothetical protein